MFTLLKFAITKIWEGFLQNIGVILLAFLLSGGYLIAINKLVAFQATVRAVPSDYFLTPLILLLVVLGAMIRINLKQKAQITDLQQVPLKLESDARFVTHLGVWWKLYPSSEYIEDFPYCPCCDPHVKLVQTEWHPDEIFICPITKTEIQLYNSVPREKDAVLQNLYDVYFRSLPDQLHEQYVSEYRRLKELNPDQEEKELTKLLFRLDPLCKIPVEEQLEIFNAQPQPMQAYHFVDRYFARYRKYMRADDSGSPGT